MKKIMPVLTKDSGSVICRVTKEKFVVKERFFEREHREFIREINHDFVLYFNELVEKAQPGIRLINLKYHTLLYRASVPEIINDLGGMKKFKSVPVSVVYDLMEDQRSRESPVGPLLVNGHANVFPMVTDSKGELRQLEIQFGGNAGCIPAWHVSTFPIKTKFDHEKGDRIFLVTKQ